MLLCVSVISALELKKGLGYANDYSMADASLPLLQFRTACMEFPATKLGLSLSPCKTQDPLAPLSLTPHQPFLVENVNMPLRSPPCSLAMATS